MRGKANEVQSDVDKYGFRPLTSSIGKKKRLDLNDLLKRAKEAKKYDKKINYSIFFGMFSIVVVFLLILNVE